MLLNVRIIDEIERTLDFFSYLHFEIATSDPFQAQTSPNRPEKKFNWPAKAQDVTRNASVCIPYCSAGKKKTNHLDRSTANHRSPENFDSCTHAREPMRNNVAAGRVGG